MAHKRVIEISISDPETILLLQCYHQFLAEEDGVTGSMGKIVEGMALAFMDEHDNFRAWCTKRALATSGGTQA